MSIITTFDLAKTIRSRRLALGLRQQDVALAANVGIRFIVDVENGKETSQIGLILKLLNSLGIELTANMSPVPTSQDSNDEPDSFDPDNFSPTP